MRSRRRSRSPTIGPVDEEGSTAPDADHAAGVDPPETPDPSRGPGPSLPPPPVSGGLREGPRSPLATPRTGPVGGPDPGAVLMLAGGVLTAVALFLPRFPGTGLRGGRTGS